MIVRSEINLTFSRRSPRLWEVVGSKGDTYRLALSNSGLTCSCLGYTAHGHCYHVAQLMENIKEDISMYNALQNSEEHHPAETLKEHYKALFSLGYNPTDEDEEEQNYSTNSSARSARYATLDSHQRSTVMNNFPEAIATLSRQILRMDREIRQLTESVGFALNSIDRPIAFDAELKNDAQRKAKRTELMESDSDYVESLISLRKAQDRRAELEIDLFLIRNQFSVWKLERRETIAIMELEVA